MNKLSVNKLNAAMLKDYRERRYDYIPSERSPLIQEWLEEWFKARFGADYWRLPKKHKEVHFASCAAELLLGLDIILQQQEKPSSVINQPNTGDRPNITDRPC